jgi:ubiquinone/menaquinone biosynthesis C-methylase UbiE
MTKEKDYVLGTHDEEIERLGTQNTIWRPHASMAWQRAGFTARQTLLDVGCGPGWATMDLAGIVGKQGRVIGVDRSRRFLDAAIASAEARGIAQVEFHELDLDEQPLPNVRADGAWSRWVYSFVRKPQDVLRKVAAVVKPGGAMVLHEYVDYRAWRLSPPRPEFERFVDEVMASWRDTGGEPDIGLVLPRWLEECGFEVRAIRPIIETPRRGDFFWQWPDIFVNVGLQRLVDLGRVTAEQADGIRRAFRESQQSPGAFQLTPTVLEIIAYKR